MANPHNGAPHLAMNIAVLMQIPQLGRHNHSRPRDLETDIRPRLRAAPKIGRQRCPVERPLCDKTIGVRLIWIGVFVCNVLVAGCAHNSVATADPAPAASDEKVWWSPQLSLPSLQAIPEALGAPFATPIDVTLQSPAGEVRQAVMTNCETLLALRSKGYEAISENDLAAMKTEATRCQTLQLLRTTPVVSRPSGARFSLDQNILSTLPPALGPGPSPGQRARREDATRRGIPWGTLDSEATTATTGRESATVKGGDWTTRLEVMARGDFTGDGVADVLLRTVSYGTEGSWREVRLRVLFQDSNNVGSKLIWSIEKELPL